jgi:hypothetical protein
MPEPVLNSDFDFVFELDAFDGPLDLLLYLIKKDEIDINPSIPRIPGGLQGAESGNRRGIPVYVRRAYPHQGPDAYSETGR